MFVRYNGCDMYDTMAPGGWTMENSVQRIPKAYWSHAWPWLAGRSERFENIWVWLIKTIGISHWHPLVTFFFCTRAEQTLIPNTEAKVTRLINKSCTPKRFSVSTSDRLVSLCQDYRNWTVHTHTNLERFGTYLRLKGPGSLSHGRSDLPCLRLSMGMIVVWS